MNGNLPARVAVPLGVFLTGIFDLVDDSQARSVHLNSFPGSPRDKDAARWGGFRWAYRAGQGWRRYLELPDGNNQYFSVGLMRADSVGRSDALVYANPLIALDDVGTKVPIRQVREQITTFGMLPAAVIETSRGNYTLLYKVAERFELDRGSRVRAALCALGLCDASVHDRSRYMRLPYGVNAKGLPWWPVHMRAWRPQELTTYAQWEAVIRAAGGSLAAVHVPMVGERMASMEDPWVQLAQQVGLDPHEVRPGVIAADCPFTHEHTAEDPSGFAFVNWQRCHCHHGHCASRRTPQFLERIAELYHEQTGESAEHWLASRAFSAEPFTLPKLPKHFERNRE